MNLNLNMPTIDYDALPPVKKYLLLFLPSALIIALALVVFILPSLDEREILVKELELQTKEIADAKQKAARLEQLIADNEKLKQKLKELHLQLPEEKEISTLLRQVSEKGIESGLVIGSWKPGNKTVHESQQVYAIPAEVAMSGSYHNFGKFFSEITKLNRIVTLENIMMRSAAQRKETADLNVTFTAMTYSVIPEAERKALQEAKKQEAGKKK